MEAANSSSVANNNRQSTTLNTRRSGPPPKVSAGSCNFDQVLNVLESTTKSEIDQDVEGFVNSLAFTLQKCPEEQREFLFLQIRTLVFNEMYPQRQTAPRPALSPPRGAEPNLLLQPRTRPASAPSMYGDQIRYQTWGPPPAYQSVHAGPRMRGCAFRAPVSSARGRHPVSPARDGDGEELLYEREVPFEEI